ncbi:hypothetical protein [Shewanella baltica]|uniref:hypothetical protein n=1 Tax=Shewanella baltica TaxID=62322 RepID=UPI00217D1F2E|nr:hypothetical protein [Shewanella baltica]
MSLAPTSSNLALAANEVIGIASKNEKREAASRLKPSNATVDEKRGLIYRMRLNMKKSTIMVEGKEIKLIPGMAVTAEVQTGKRRIIEFFIAPLLRYRQESIRER